MIPYVSLILENREASARVYWRVHIEQTKNESENYEKKASLGRGVTTWDSSLKLSKEKQILLDFWRLQSLLFTVFLERKLCFSINLIELEREARKVNSFKNIANGV